jgi:hypothetical protein
MSCASYAPNNSSPNPNASGATTRTSQRGRPPKRWTNIDRDYETLRLAMQTLFGHLGIATKAAAAA